MVLSFNLFSNPLLFLFVLSFKCRIIFWMPLEFLHAIKMFEEGFWICASLKNVEDKKFVSFEFESEWFHLCMSDDSELYWEIFATCTIGATLWWHGHTYLHRIFHVYLLKMFWYIETYSHDGIITVNLSELCFQKSFTSKTRTTKRP